MSTLNGNSRFDRVRPRTPAATAVQPASGAAPHHDVEGKRALFSTVESARPVMSGIEIDCSRCDQQTVLSPLAALRAMFPAVHFAVGIGRGERETVVGLLRGRRYPSWLRCPACGHGSWVRVTVRL